MKKKSFNLSRAFSQDHEATGNVIGKLLDKSRKSEPLEKGRKDKGVSALLKGSEETTPGPTHP